MSSPIIEQRREAILHLTIDRADKRNALNAEVVRGLRAALRAAAGDDSLIAVVLRGAGNKAFAAGGDLRELQQLQGQAEVEAYHREVVELLDAVRRFPLPVVAALNGDALGGGFELALACDVRIADRKARIALLQGTLALPAAWGGGVDLMQLVGPSRAIELLASSRFLSAEEALGVRLVEFLVPRHQNLDGCVDVIMQSWRHQRPQVMRALKAQAIAHRDGVPRAQRDAEDFRRMIECWMHPDHFAAAERRIAAISR